MFNGKACELDSHPLIIQVTNGSLAFDQASGTLQ